MDSLESLERKYRSLSDKELADEIRYRKESKWTNHMILSDGLDISRNVIKVCENLLHKRGSDCMLR